MIKYKDRLRRKMMKKMKKEKAVEELKEIKEKIKSQRKVKIVKERMVITAQLEQEELLMIDEEDLMKKEFLLFERARHNKMLRNLLIQKIKVQERLETINMELEMMEEFEELAALEPVPA